MRRSGNNPLADSETKLKIRTIARAATKNRLLQERLGHWKAAMQAKCEELRAAVAAWQACAGLTCWPCAPNGMQCARHAFKACSPPGCRQLYERRAEASLQLRQRTVEPHNSVSLSTANSEEIRSLCVPKT